MAPRSLWLAMVAVFLSSLNFGELANAPVCYPPCTACDSSSVCTQCQTGNWGTVCENQCPGNCKADLCDQASGRCTSGCVDGFYGSMCSSPCSGNCSRCEGAAFQCSACMPGYYGSGCLVACYGNCLNDICQYDGTCSQCKAGFYGHACLSPCGANCSKCTFVLDCTECDPGLYGTGCSQNCITTCQDNSCDIRTGYCPDDACTDGRYGTPRCPCPDNCKSASCDPESGVCNQGCNSGYFGVSCDSNCPRNCLDAACDSTTGVCIHGCTVGYYGETCESSCPLNCKNAVCHATSGTCSDSCNDGFYGNTCELQCYAACSTCHDTATNCTGCMQGYYGASCEESCPTDCADGICGQDSGDCLSHCKAGYYGESCNVPCPPGCISCTGPTSCTQCHLGHTGKGCCHENCINGLCSIESGYCKLGCRSGYHGKKCNLPCAENCVSCLLSGDCLECKYGFYGARCTEACSPWCALTNGKLKCRIYDGACTGGCMLSTKHGLQCQKDCNDHCVDGECDQLTGRCRKGCDRGFHGVSCDGKCSVNCVDNLCLGVNGTCVKGCTEGFLGDDCRQSPTSETGGVNLTTVGGAVAAGIGVAAIILVIAIAIVVMRRRDRFSPENPKERRKAGEQVTPPEQLSTETGQESLGSAQFGKQTNGDSVGTVSTYCEVGGGTYLTPCEASDGTSFPGSSFYIDVHGCPSDASHYETIDPELLELRARLDAIQLDTETASRDLEKKRLQEQIELAQQELGRIRGHL